MGQLEIVCSAIVKDCLYLILFFAEAFLAESPGPAAERQPVYPFVWLASADAAMSLAVKHLIASW